MYSPSLAGCTTGYPKFAPANLLEAVPARRGEGSKTTEFRYLLERKVLRIMRRYYKEGFEKLFKYKNKMREMTDSEMDQMLSTYTS
jgi:hypothetical protein